jgi:hypothetical protein
MLLLLTRKRGDEMKKLTTPFLLSLCALTLLSACAKDKTNQDNVGVAPIVNPGDDINLPDERGSDRQGNIQMIRGGIRESDEIRRRSGLMPLMYDQNLTIIAQRRARDIRSGNGFGQGTGQNNNQWQDPQQMPAGPDGRPGSGNMNQSRDWQGANDGRDGRDHHDGRGDHNGRDGRDGRGNERGFPGQPDSAYAAENTLSGLRSPEQAYIYFSRTQSTRVNLLSQIYRRHGIGYSDGTWVEIFAY